MTLPVWVASSLGMGAACLAYMVCRGYSLNRRDGTERSTTDNAALVLKFSVPWLAVFLPFVQP